MQIRYISKRGNNKGKIYKPHIFKDGNYIVSKTRYKEDYVPVGTEEELIKYIKKGYGVRMSCDGKSPSLIFLNPQEISE